MLILTRITGETIVVGDHVQVTVMDIKGCQVRLGIEAPRTVTVDRAEIFRRKQRTGGAKAVEPKRTS